MNHNADGLQVTYDGLDFAATNIANEARQLDEDIQHLRQLVRNSKQYWVGKAQSTFDQKLAAWDKEAADIHEALRGIGHVVGQSGGTYMDGDLAASKYLA
ncbi:MULTISPECIES: WXG100 family type VII secretion target [unclassified Streptomyces]|uniref:WXG100 family type VII secretion target n=1 Tax=unclassified Streptomyces TaxID=2593676 RepID=UPI001367BE01|nr:MULTISPECIES: WXG100 family type VII secretion target [unclassified Streptomyces]MCW5254467.1 WXG100 family type VII secretion target [Streptomyces sp. SHP 1-2]MYU22020.1 WXG100 family type VII secretion target [Streptomyces sp. SID8352]